MDIEEKYEMYVKKCEREKNHLAKEVESVRRAKLKIMTDAILMDMETDPDYWFKKEDFNNLRIYNSTKALLANKGRTWKFMRCCFTVKPEVDFKGNFDDWKKRLERIFKWKWMEEITYNFEWRNHANMKGMHCHALVKLRDGKKFSSARSQLVKGYSNWGYVQVLPTNDKCDKYIKGIKKGKKKEEMVKKDIEIRKTMGLKDWYKISQ